MAIFGIFYTFFSHFCHFLHWKTPFTYANQQYIQTGLDECMFSIRGIIYYLIYMINGPKWPFFTILPLFELQWGLIFFLFHLFHASWSEITHSKNHRKYFFIKINIFGIFGQKPSFRGPGTVPSSAKWLQRVQIQVFVRSIENLFCPILLIEDFLEKYFLMKIDIFGIFGPKTEKMGHA